MSIYFEKDDQKIVKLTLDMASSSTNMVNNEFLNALDHVIEQITKDQEITGVIITSGQKIFSAGGDFQQLYHAKSVSDVHKIIERFKRLLRSLEIWGKPVVAAMNGTTLGGGFELALACNYRIALNDPKLQIGLPEVNFGLFPGGGGTQRLSRLIGIQEAVLFIIAGKVLTPEDALNQGVVHELGTNNEMMIAKAKEWILANPSVTQPWDANHFTWPGISPHNPEIAQFWSLAPSKFNKKTYGNHPAINYILACVHEGSLVNFDTACRIEGRYFTKCVLSPSAKNMINSLWFQLNTIKKGERRPTNIEPHTIQKLGILGAGMMGSGIAYVSALNGMQVVLKDLSPAQAEAGKNHSKNILDRQVQLNRVTVAQKEEVLARIHLTDNLADFQGCDLVIETIFENRDMKARVIQEIEGHLSDFAFFASNTSALPITGLANYTDRPENFIGIHFFSPVDKMRLVEVIVGKKTNEATLAKALDYVKQIQKIPIVVNDSWGFYTTRVFMTYVMEGIALLEEGNLPQAIASAGLLSGMPVEPLALSDEVSLSLLDHVLRQMDNDRKNQEIPIQKMPGTDVVKMMVHTLNRLGKKARQGFYEYPEKGKKFIWPELNRYFPQKAHLPQNEIVTRLMFTQVLETVRCFEEKVVTTVSEANIGSIFGVGFPSFKGGTLQYINDYGFQKFVDKTQQLADQYGPRFTPPNLLLEMIKNGEIF